MAAEKIIRGLTLHRPWIWCVVRGPKRIENRPWAPPAGFVGNYLALHAGKEWDYDGARKILSLLPAMPREGGEHPAGLIVGVARVVGVAGASGAVDPRALAAASACRLPAGDPLRPGDAPWFTGPYGWLLDHVLPIAPVRARGLQGLFPLPADVLAAVRAGFRAARSR